MGDRWLHVAGVAQNAERLGEHSGLVTEDVISAAWLHDIGYAPALAAAGFHPLDGGRFLLQVGVPDSIVALVAHHTGAQYEAKARGLVDAWGQMPAPDPVALDILTMIDLGTGPRGQRMLDVHRVADILRRYPSEDPVHRAVSRSCPVLLDASARAKGLLGLSDDWPLAISEGVGNAQSHGRV